MPKIKKASESLTPKKIILLFDGIVKAELDVDLYDLDTPLFEKHGGDAMFGGTIHTTNGFRYIFSIERIKNSKSRRFKPNEIKEMINDCDNDND